MFEHYYHPVADHKSDEDAWYVLKEHYIDNCGVITPRDRKYFPTKEEHNAIVYLCQEWDHSIEWEPIETHTLIDLKIEHECIQVEDGENVECPICKIRIKYCKVCGGSDFYNTYTTQCIRRGLTRSELRVLEDNKDEDYIFDSWVSD